MGKFRNIIEELKSDVRDLRNEKEKLLEILQKDKLEIVRLSDMVVELEKVRDEVMKSHVKLRGMLIKIMSYVRGFEDDI